MRKKSTNKGFSLLELIVVLAIMSVLIAIVVPQFFKYINSNRAKACRINREAILAIYERCVYAGELDVNTTDLKELLDGTYVKTEKEVKQYNKCPDGGSYTASVVDNKAYIKCKPGHDDVVVDFSLLEGTEYPEVIDAPFPTPTPFPTVMPIPTPTPTPTPTPFVDNTWPWPYDNDERWNDVGRTPGSSVVIDVPTKPFQGIDGAWYVIVARNGDKFTIHYEWNSGPEVAQAYLTAQGNEDIISWSGVTITEPTLVNNGKQITGINFGDIVACNGKKYIMTSRSSSYENWPLSGNKSGNFYLVGNE